MSRLRREGLLRKSLQLEGICGIDKIRHSVYDDSKS